MPVQAAIVYNVLPSFDPRSPLRPTESPPPSHCHRRLLSHRRLQTRLANPSFRPFVHPVVKQTQYHYLTNRCHGYGQASCTQHTTQVSVTSLSWYHTRGAQLRTGVYCLKCKYRFICGSTFTAEIAW